MAKRPGVKQKKASVKKTRPTAAKGESAATVQKPAAGNETARIRRWNGWLAGLYAVQGIGILLFSVTRHFPAGTSYFTNDPIASELAGKPVTGLAMHHLFDINLAVLVALMLFLSAILHGLAATVCRQRYYEPALRKGQSWLRWTIYGLSGGLLLVAIATVSGIADFATLFMIFTLTAIAGLAGFVLDGKQDTDSRWPMYALGAVAGAVPWLVVAGSLWAASVYGSGTVSGFVYWLFGTLLAVHLITVFSVCQSGKRTSRWQDYLYSERLLLLLSLLAQTLLAWQLFAGALRP